ncbi:lytic transglycosylase [Afipia massiliensis]|uniref:peptidoglycan lytic exotransglycosylase n=1 Tax=Afipia massiliensis TaxID=211460 RepID=A0A4U6BTB8_9BRAD|nr:lytic transglycosylase [Afipia massiliensis]
MTDVEARTAGRDVSHDHHEAPKRGPVVWPLVVPDGQYAPLKWNEVVGWADDDPLPAFKTFRTSCKPIAAQKTPVADSKALGTSLRDPCIAARAEDISESAKAREFFEKNFTPLQISRIGEDAGFVTGYYEPIVDGSRVQTDVYNVPVYRRPSNLFVRGYSQANASMPNKGQVFRKIGRRKLVPYYDRAEIEDGAIAGRGLEVVWLKSQTDLLFIQIQGSARIKLDDGSIVRINYDAHNGYPYTPVGRVLIERNIIPKDQMSMQKIREYMEQSPDAAKELRRFNRSYVFFREVKLAADDEAVGAQGVPLTAGRSIAVDKSLHVYGTPFFIEGNLPIESDTSNTPFRKLMIAQDTGSAIIGPARADIYFGAGADAGRVAGRLKNPARFVMLLPNSLDPVARGKTMPLPEDRPSATIAKLFPQTEPPKEAVKETPKELAKEGAKETSKDTSKEQPKDSSKDVSKDSAKSAPSKDQPAAAQTPAVATAPAVAATAQAVPLPEARPKTAPDVASAATVKPDTPRRKRHHRRYRHRQ